MRITHNNMVIGALIVLAFSSCASLKKSVSTTKSTVDSTVIAEKDSIIRVEKSRSERLESELRELQTTGVQFDTVFVAGDTVVNTVIVKADGTVEATGRIKSVNVTNQKLQRIISDLQEKNDSLAQVKQRVETKVITNTVTKEKDVKRTWPWWWFAICAVVGFVLGAVFKNKILSLFKIKSMKLLQVLFAITICMLLTSCGKFSDGTSVWQEGLWILPLLTFGGFVVFAVRGYMVWKSGTVTEDQFGKQTFSKQRLKWYKNGSWIFALIFLLATIGIIYWVNADK